MHGHLQERIDKAKIQLVIILQPTQLKFLSDLIKTSPVAIRNKGYFRTITVLFFKFIG